MSFAHIPLKQKHIDHIMGIAHSRGLTSHHVKEIELFLHEAISDREDKRLSIQDLLDALAEFMELDYSVADIASNPKIIPIIVGLAPHVADLTELANSLADDGPEVSHSAPEDADDPDHNARCGDADDGLAEPAFAVSRGLEEWGNGQARDDEVSSADEDSSADEEDEADDIGEGEGEGERDDDDADADDDEELSSDDDGETSEEEDP